MGFMFWVWLCVMIISVIIELSTINLTSFWFSIGAIPALVISIFTPNKVVYILIQCLVFAIVSLAAIIFLRPIFKKKFDSPQIATNIDSMIGKVVIVETEITPTQPGSIKTEGIEWSAISNDERLEPGDFVTIDKVEGNTFTVCKFNKEKENKK